MGLLEKISEDDLVYWIASLASEDVYESNLIPPDMSESLFSFLQSKQGPHLSLSTMQLLSDIGISNDTELLNFANQNFSDMFSSLSDWHFYSLTSNCLPYVMLCGLNLSEHNLIQGDGHIRYHKPILKTFQDAFLQELELHINIAHEGQTLQTFSFTLCTLPQGLQEFPHIVSAHTSTASQLEACTALCDPVPCVHTPPPTQMRALPTVAMGDTYCFR